MNLRFHFFVLLFIAACGGSFRVVSESKTGGEMVLDGSRESAMKKAREQMTHICGGDTAYEITEEGEIGYGGAVVPKGTDPHEWHVHYTCNAAPSDAGTD